MSSHLFHKLEEKVQQAIETIELLRLQLEESETRNSNLQAEVNEFKNRQREWEQSLSTLLQKLASTDFSVTTLSTASASKMKFAEESYLEKEEAAV